ncbi:MAG: hypothetical protein LUD77_02340 [Clostridiales bacterium]|nr:hypothetical protein [Clostridiales bacterium]
MTDTEKTAVAKMVEWVKQYDSNMTIEALVEDDNEQNPFADTESGDVIEPM